METPRWVTIGFIISGLINIVAVLLATHGFTAPEGISKWDPGAFSLLGLVCIPVWGLTYIAVAHHVAKLPNIALVFCIEKIVYVTNYVNWNMTTGGDLQPIFEESFLPGLFYAVYGGNDLIFALFFAAVFVKLKTTPKSDA